MKHELNSQNTKEILCDALISLSAKKPFSKITVSEIVNLCDINRKTFYYHFTDVYDLLEWHLNQEIEKAIAAFDPISDLSASITYSINYMNQNPHLKNFVKDPIAKDKITNILTKSLYPKAEEIIQKLESVHAQYIEPDFRAFIIKNFTRIVVLSILDNIENPNNYNDEKLKQYITKIFDMSMYGLFQQL